MGLIKSTCSPHHSHFFLLPETIFNPLIHKLSHMQLFFRIHNHIPQTNYTKSKIWKKLSHMTFYFSIQPTQQKLYKAFLSFFFFFQSFVIFLPKLSDRTFYHCWKLALLENYAKHTLIHFHLRACVLSSFSFWEGKYFRQVELRFLEMLAFQTISTWFIAPNVVYSTDRLWDTKKRQEIMPCLYDQLCRINRSSGKFSDLAHSSGPPEWKKESLILQ